MRSDCDGKLLTVSFHVRSDEEILTYLYYMGEMITFKEMDIVRILPRLFDMNWSSNADEVRDNEEYLKKKHYSEIYHKMVLSNLHDRRCREFVHECQNYT